MSVPSCPCRSHPLTDLRAFQFLRIYLVYIPRLNVVYFRDFICRLCSLDFGAMHLPLATAVDPLEKCGGEIQSRCASSMLVKHPQRTHAIIALVLSPTAIGRPPMFCIHTKPRPCTFSSVILYKTSYNNVLHSQLS